jgi:alpha-glucosidase
MQWDDAPNAGFTEGTPWLPVPPNSKTRNVATELKDQSSILNVYRKLLGLRRENPALRDGEYIPLNESDQNVLAYLRRYKDEVVLVVLNMSAQSQQVALELSAQGLAGKAAPVLLTTANGSPQDVPVSQISLEPFAAYVAELSK